MLLSDVLRGLPSCTACSASEGGLLSILSLAMSPSFSRISATFGVHNCPVEDEYNGNNGAGTFSRFTASAVSA